MRILNTNYPHSIQKLGLAKKQSNSKHKEDHMSTMHLRTSRLSAIELNIWKISELLLWGTKTPQPILLFCFVGCCGSQLQYSKDYKRGSWIEWNAKMGFIDMCFRVGATFEWSFNLHWLWGYSRLSQNMHPSRKIPSEIEVAPRYTVNCLCLHCWHCWNCSYYSNCFTLLKQ